jgi:hypothetical protein
MTFIDEWKLIDDRISGLRSAFQVLCDVSQSAGNDTNNVSDKYLYGQMSRTRLEIDAFFGKYRHMLSGDEQ